jgi:hypothetical protein
VSDGCSLQRRGCTWSALLRWTYRSTHQFWYSFSVCLYTVLTKCVCADCRGADMATGEDRRVPHEGATNNERRRRGRRRDRRGGQLGGTLGNKRERQRESCAVLPFLAAPPFLTSFPFSCFPCCAVLCSALHQTRKPHSSRQTSQAGARARTPSEGRGRCREDPCCACSLRVAALCLRGLGSVSLSQPERIRARGASTGR